MGILKAKTQDFNNVFVSRSADAGIELDATVLVFAEPLFSANVNVFPAIAVDPRERQRLCHLVERELRRYQCPLFLFRGWRDVRTRHADTINTAPANTAISHGSPLGPAPLTSHYRTTGANKAGACQRLPGADNQQRRKLFSELRTRR